MSMKIQFSDEIVEEGRYYWDNVTKSSLLLADWMADAVSEMPHFRSELIIDCAVKWGAPKSSLRDYARVGLAWPRGRREQYPYIGENYSMLRVLTDGDEPNLELAKKADEEQLSVDKVKSLKANETPWHLKLRNWLGRFRKMLANLSQEEKVELYEVIKKELEDEG